MNRRDPGTHDHDGQRGRHTRQGIGVPGWFDLHLETDRHSEDAVLTLDGILTAITRVDIVHQRPPARTHADVRADQQEASHRPSATHGKVTKARD